MYWILLVRWVLNRWHRNVFQTYLTLKHLRFRCLFCINFSLSYSCSDRFTDPGLFVSCLPSIIIIHYYTKRFFSLYGISFCKHRSLLDLRIRLRHGLLGHHSLPRELLNRELKREDVLPLLVWNRKEGFQYHFWVTVSISVSIMYYCETWRMQWGNSILQ